MSIQKDFRRDFRITGSFFANILILPSMLVILSLYHTILDFLFLDLLFHEFLLIFFLTKNSSSLFPIDWRTLHQLISPMSREEPFNDTLKKRARSEITVAATQTFQRTVNLLNNSSSSSTNKQKTHTKKKP